MYDINYDDDRFKKVESAKQDALNQANNTYNQMINGTDKVYQDLVDATNNYAQTQSDLQQQRTDFTIEKINQEKEKSERDYIKEQKGAYSDYQKAIDQYGINAEANASQGLKNSGYSETSRISAFNTYQNRYATARQSYNDALLNYNNSIKEAQLANSSALAEISFNALKTQLETTIQGFQYKNTLLQSQLQTQMDIDNNYYNRWADVLQQMNTENALKEQIRQYNEQFAYQKERDAIADQQWEREYALSVAKSSSRSSGGSGGGNSKYTTGVVPYGQLASSTPDGKGYVIYTDTNGNTYKMKEGYNPYTGTKNGDVSKGVFSNGYQPSTYNGKKLTVATNSKGEKVQGDINGNTQNIWKSGNTYVYWDGTKNTYKELNKSEKKAFGLN